MGFLFLVVYSRLPACLPACLLLLPPPPHNLLTHHLLAHHLLTHIVLTHNLLTQTLLTHHLLSHTHTQLSHTHNSHTHTELTHIHTLTHNHNALQFTDTQLGVALRLIELHFAWQAWHLVTWIVTLRGERGTYGTWLALVARLGPVWRRCCRGCL